ncbi:MAG: glycosyltransferase family 4 protein [Deltaproteobacteria bacterium]|nr:glycosyltransferase family 4 protein [Deltaproteobacteria bacterium]
MKVTISVMGRFHAFYLAHELQRRGHLERLITSYPKFEMNRGWRRAPNLVKARYNAQYLIHELFDRRAARHLPSQPELVVGWSSFSLHTLRRARELGAKTVLDHGSCHIAAQDEILREEYSRLGLRGHEFAHPKIIAKELLEYREVDCITIPSGFVRETFIQRGVPEAKLLLAPYGVNLTNFYPSPKLDRVFRIIHCGNISLRKGVHYLLQAFAELKLPDAELWLIGSLTEEIRPILQRLASPNIRHLGPFPEPELHKYYSQGSVFCLNSIEDGFGMVLVQAMACGLPVITTTNTGGADAVREGRDGFIIPIRDVAALKEKMLYFYKNPEAGRSMGEAARERVQTGFTWADYGDKIIAGYRRVLDGRAREA